MSDTPAVPGELCGSAVEQHLGGLDLRDSARGNGGGRGRSFRGRRRYNFGDDGRLQGRRAGLILSLSGVDKKGRTWDLKGGCFWARSSTWRRSFSGCMATTTGAFHVYADGCGLKREGGIVACDCSKHVWVQGAENGDPGGRVVGSAPLASAGIGTSRIVVS